MVAKTIFLAVIALGLFVTGCARPEVRTDEIRVGMSISEACRVWATNGARVVTLSDPVGGPKGSASAGVSLAIPGNRTLTLLYNTNRGEEITRMELCTNPEVPKNLRKISAVDKIELKAPGTK